MFSREYWQIFKSTCFYRTPLADCLNIWTTAAFLRTEYKSARAAADAHKRK